MKEEVLQEMMSPLMNGVDERQMGYDPKMVEIGRRNSENSDDFERFERNRGTQGSQNLDDIKVDIRMSRITHETPKNFLKEGPLIHKSHDYRNLQDITTPVQDQLSHREMESSTPFKKNMSLIVSPIRSNANSFMDMNWVSVNFLLFLE